MWSKKYTYRIIEDEVYDFGNSSWVDDWFDFSLMKGLDSGLSDILAESFAVQVSNLMCNSEVFDFPDSYLKERMIRREVCGFVGLEKDFVCEREQKRNVFFKVLDLYCFDIGRFEKRTVQVHAHLPVDVWRYVKERGVGDYVSEQSRRFLKDRCVYVDSVVGHKLGSSKDCSLHFLLTPSEYDVFRQVDGDSFSNKILNLYLHDVERNRQRGRRLEILDRFFPNRSRS